MLAAAAGTAAFSQLGLQVKIFVVDSFVTAARPLPPFFPLYFGS